MNKYIRLIPALAFGMAVLSTPALATAATTINVVGPVQLLAKGAGVLVPVEVTCDASFGSGSHAFVDVRILQRAGRLIEGFGSVSSDTMNCDGTPQPFGVLVTTGSQRFFRQGAAIAQAFTTVCDPDFNVCEGAQMTEEVQIVK